MNHVQIMAWLWIFRMDFISFNWMMCSKILSTLITILGDHLIVFLHILRCVIYFMPLNINKFPVFNYLQKYQLAVRSAISRKECVWLHLQWRPASRRDAISVLLCYLVLCFAYHVPHYVATCLGLLLVWWW